MAADLQLEPEALRGASCPGCGSPLLELHREGGDAARPVHAATCGGCDLTFRILSGTPPEAVAARLPGLGCPECGRREARFLRVCRLPGLNCGLRVRCGGCGAEYGEELL